MDDKFDLSTAEIIEKSLGVDKIEDNEQRSNILIKTAVELIMLSVKVSGNNMDAPSIVLGGNLNHKNFIFATGEIGEKFSKYLAEEIMGGVDPEDFPSMSKSRVQ